MSRLFYCNWGGTDLINSSPPSGENEYDSVLNESSGVWEKKTDGGGWNGSTNYALATTKLENRLCGVVLSGLARQVSSRFMFRLDTLGMVDGKNVMIRRHSTGVNTQIGIDIYNNSDSPRLIGIYRNSSNDLARFDNSTSPTVPSGVDIETGKWYQIEAIWKQTTSGGASFKVWNETGSTQIGSTQVCDGTTSSPGVDVENCRIGSINYLIGTVSTGADNVMRFSRDEIWDDYSFPGPIVTFNPSWARNSNQVLINGEQL